ncbi:MAG TPA: type II secretion system protein [Oculatellaceae cyanobacterium]
MLRRSRPAFTLAELLIALGILGVIATFAIPKVLSSQQDSKKKAVLQETISALNAAFTPACLRKEVSDANFGTFIRTHINAVKVCPGNSITQGCWPDPDLAGQGIQPGLVMHNGAMVAGLDNDDGGTGMDTLIIDWNGEEGPNTQGQDRLVLRAPFDNTSTTDRVCTIRWDPMHGASQSLWLWAFE